MIFTRELKRRRGMKPEEVAKVEKVFFENIKGLPPEMIKREAWQTVGWFQGYMEHGSFCLPGEQVKITEKGRALLHIVRVDRRDLRAAANTFKKAIESVRVLARDTGAWDEFQRRLWE